MTSADAVGETVAPPGPEMMGLHALRSTAARMNARFMLLLLYSAEGTRGLRVPSRFGRRYGQLNVTAADCPWDLPWDLVAPCACAGRCALAASRAVAACAARSHGCALSFFRLQTTSQPRCCFMV